VQASLLLLSIGLLVGVHAQSSTTGNITGTVRDPQGAAVPKAEVTITDEKTGASRTVTATEDGFYNATSLPAGMYSISTAPAGFKKTVTTSVELPSDIVSSHPTVMRSMVGWAQRVLRDRLPGRGR